MHRDEFRSSGKSVPLEPPPDKAEGNGGKIVVKENR